MMKEEKKVPSSQVIDTLSIKHLMKGILDLKTICLAGVNYILSRRKLYT